MMLANNTLNPTGQDTAKITAQYTSDDNPGEARPHKITP